MKHKKSVRCSKLINKLFFGACCNQIKQQARTVQGLLSYVGK